MVKLQAYLEEYGLRQDLFEYSTPTWQEDPSFALSSIRSYVLTERNARAEHAAMARSAESALAAAREQLMMYPEAVRNQFEAMVQFGRQGTFLQEEHNFYIDQRGLALLRLFYLRVGERFVEQGRLAAPDDVFMLTIDELRRVVGDTGNTEAANQVRALVQTRLDEMDLARRLTPPPFIGAAPAGPPPPATRWSEPWAGFSGGHRSSRYARSTQGQRRVTGRGNRYCAGRTHPGRGDARSPWRDPGCGHDDAGLDPALRSSGRSRHRDRWAA